MEIRFPAIVLEYRLAVLSGFLCVPLRSTGMMFIVVIAWSFFYGLIYGAFLTRQDLTSALPVVCILLYALVEPVSPSKVYSVSYTLHFPRDLTIALILRREGDILTLPSSSSHFRKRRRGCESILWGRSRTPFQNGDCWNFLTENGA